MRRMDVRWCTVRVTMNNDALIGAGLAITDSWSTSREILGCVFLM
jgi:hypothetical protein